MTQVIEVTNADVELIFAEMHNEFHCNVFLYFFITECPQQALDHMVTEHKTEIDMMEADLLALQNGATMPFRLTAAQLREMEEERPGAETIAPYIAF